MDVLYFNVTRNGRSDKKKNAEGDHMKVYRVSISCLEETKFPSTRFLIYLQWDNVTDGEH